jgi:hypothetical protein
MAKICILNTKAVADSAGAPFDSQVRGKSSTSPVRTKPVRLFSGDGETRYCGFEFLFDGNAGDALALRFFVEFWADDIAASLATPPTLRSLDEIDPSAPWAREVNEEVAAGGTITHSAVERALDLTIPTGAVAVCRYVPLLFHASWVRLACWPNVAYSAGNLRIYAHVGGHSEASYLKTNESLPYAYNANVV